MITVNIQRGGSRMMFTMLVRLIEAVGITLTTEVMYTSIPRTTLSHWVYDPRVPHLDMGLLLISKIRCLTYFPISLGNDSCKWLTLFIARNLKLKRFNVPPTVPRRDVHKP